MPENTMTDQERAEIIRIERQRVSEITGMGAHFGCEEIARNLVNSGATEDQARKSIMDHLSRTKVDPQLPVRGNYGEYQVGQSDMEKRSAAMVDGMVLRSGLAIEKPAPGANEFRVQSLVDIAKECLAMSGKSTRGLGKNDIVREALSTRSHSTSDFPYLLSNVANKTLRDSYELAPSSFEKWVSISDGTDFKEMSRHQISEGPDLDEIAELEEYTYGTFGESRETFQIKTYGRLFAISRQAIVNDDLGAFTRIPRAFAASAKRRINALVYGILIDNAAMSDGYNLFSSEHGNLHDSGSEMSISQLSVGRLAMRTQTGINGATLNIVPKFLITSATNETNADVLLNTSQGYDITAGVGQNNPFYRRLEVVVESLLDDNSLSDAWFLAASPSQIDTVEVCFLDGRRSPYLETQDGWTVDGTEFKARIDVGVAAIDHRGLYKNPGSSE